MNQEDTTLQTTSSLSVNGITQFLSKDLKINENPAHNDQNEQQFKEFLERTTNQELPTAESLLRNFSEDERQYKIVDLNNSCVYDVRNEEDIEKLSMMDTMQSTTTQSPVKLQKRPSWEEFWKNVKRCNIELIDAAEIGNIDKIRFLLDKQRNLYPVDLNYPSLDQYTPLHFALSERNNNIARLLIENGANIEAETQFKRRPIHLCCIFGNYEGIQLLLEFKAQVNAQDNSQKTPVLFACEGKYPIIVELLLKNGADPLLKDANGISAVDACKDQAVFDVFKGQGYNPPQVKIIEPKVSDLKKELSKNTEETKSYEREDSRIVYGENGACCKSIQDYDYYRILGSGSFGKVILVRDKHNLKYYAMKIISKEKFAQLNLMKYALSEKNAMNQMHHPFIVQLHYAFQTSRKLILIQAYCGGGSLGRMLKIKNRFDEETAKKYLCQIVLAIEALHEKKIIFRDLKPDNIVLDDEGNSYIVDFGLAKMNAYDDITKSFLGTPAYLPPEIVQKEGHNRMADWYAVGIVLYELLMGNTPFNQGNVSREILYERIKQNTIKLPSNLSSNCQDIIKQLLCKHPKKRLGAVEDGKEVRSHPWFNGVDWDKVLQKKISMPKPVIRAIPVEPLDVKFNEECEKEINVDNWTEINQD